MKASLTLTSILSGYSSCCNTGSGRREAKMSPGRSSTGRRLIVAMAAPVIMLVALGTMELHLELQLFQRLTDPRHVAVTEDAPDAGNERLLDAVPLDILLGEEF